MAVPNVSEIIATTLEYYAPEIADNAMNSVGLFYKIKEKGGYKSVDGGEKIYEPLTFALNATAGPYSGYEQFDTTPQEVVSAAEFAWKQYGVSISASGLETDIQNTGKAQLFDLLEVRINNARDALVDNLTGDAYGAGTDHAGKVIGGLQLLLADTPTSGTVGNISRTSYTFWRNQYWSCATDGGAAAASSNIKENMAGLWLQCIRGKQHPDAIYADNTYYKYYWLALQAQQRISDEKMASMGFQTLKYVDGMADVVCDGGIGGHCPTAHMYMINHDHLFLRYAKNRNFVVIGPKQRFSTNQDAHVQLLAWAGNMTINEARCHGTLKA
jgi:hypothetical protein